MAFSNRHKLVVLFMVSLLISLLSIGFTLLGGAKVVCAQGACDSVPQRIDVSVKPDHGWNTAGSPHFINNVGLTLPVKYPSNVNGTWVRFEVPMPENVTNLNVCAINALAHFSSGSEFVYPHIWYATRTGGLANSWEVADTISSAVYVGPNMAEATWYIVAASDYSKDDTLFIAMQPAFGNSTDFSPNNHDFFIDDVWVECTIDY
jgi:hypothetical protein